MTTGWIPVGVSTPRCTEVVRIASKSKKSRREAFAALVEFWIWVSQESSDGVLEGYALDSLPHAIEGTDARFWCAVADEGWIVVTDSGLVVPENKEHQFITKGGRARLMKGRRQGRWKDKRQKSEALKETVEEALSETRDETNFDAKASPLARPTTTTTSITKPTTDKPSISDPSDGLVVGLNAEDSARCWCEADGIAKRLGLLEEAPEFLHRVAALISHGRIDGQAVAGCAAEAKKGAIENPVGLFRTKLRAAITRFEKLAASVQFTADYLRGPPEGAGSGDIVADLAKAFSNKEEP